MFQCFALYRRNEWSQDNENNVGEKKVMLAGDKIVTLRGVPMGAASGILGALARAGP